MNALKAYLAAHPGGVTPAEAARDVLRVAGPPDVVERIAREALARLPGARAGPDGRWRLEPDAEDPPAVALVVRATGPHPPLDLLLELGAAEVRNGRIGRTVGTHVRPDRPFSADAVRAAGVAPGALAGGAPLAETLSRAAPLLDGTTAVCFESERPAVFLRRALVLQGLAAAPSGTLVLAPPLRRSRCLPVRGTLSHAAAALRVPVPETGGAGDLAVTLARIYLAARERGIPLVSPPPRAAFDFGRKSFGPELLEEIPEAPGIYRFLDARGRVLYVGKSVNLRSRVSSYFKRHVRRRKLEGELVDRLDRIEWEPTGSELRALLCEVEEIRERRPPYNVQVRVRRRRPAGGDLVLFLPGPEEGEVDLLLVRSGSPAGRVRTDRRARGAREIRAAMRRAFYTREPPEGAEEEDAGIVASWLAAKADTANVLDVSETAGFEDAVRLIKAYLRDPDLFTGRILYR